MAAPEKPQLKQEVDKAVAQLRTIRDEIRLQLHLAGKEAQEAWKKLEPSLGDLEQKMGQVTEATKAKAQELLKHFNELREKVKRQPGKK
jgi:argonaute-like protein implicated in RNA metabolism and viral defense